MSCTTLAPASTIYRPAAIRIRTRPPRVSSIPNEILSDIFDYLPHANLTRIACVNSRWRAVAERLLYTSVVVSEVLPRTSASPFKNMVVSPAVPATTLRCCETLSMYPHLAEVVRRFHIRWQTDSVESPAFLLIIAKNIVRTLIPTFLSLESLELSFGLAEYFPVLPPRSFYPSFHLPSLRFLSLHGISESPELVLRNHPDLLHFKLGDFIKPLSLRPNDVPYLSSFRGYPVTAASIVPGRPVQGLSLVGYEFVTEDDLYRIASTSTPIRTLDLSGMSVTPTLLRDISRHLSHVEVLKVRLALRHTLHFALSGIRLLTALTTVLGKFHNLRRLDLSPTATVTGAAGSSDPEEELALCVAWVGACVSLRRIIFPSRTEWTLTEGGIWISESPGCTSR
ncbi:hypothetical protein FA95DRAFT_1557632 [Auriscalpium vulgare]|uniref:Uncharacterized protein n=1 Tax=Auriscalpium vulgare TaxID=40419 RepID=A0ACB8RXU3_9AGAM|nr:hypothetical protein FA95DRAFT_1557632 [Auriscalpium vulgare]